MGLSNRLDELEARVAATNLWILHTKALLRRVLVECSEEELESLRGEPVPPPWLHERAAAGREHGEGPGVTGLAGGGVT